MKEADYLWDKSGEDAQLESLEAVLKKFAYAEIDPPRVSHAQSKPERSSPFDIFKFRFALAGLSVAATCTALGLYTFTRDGDNSEISFVDRTVQQKAANGLDSECPEPCAGTRVGKSDMSNTETDTSRRTTNSDFAVNDRAMPNVIKVSHTAGPKKKKKKSVRMIYRPVRPLPQVTTAVAVTREEADAYNKLMLALSITGDKLRIVKDKLGDTRR